MICNGAPFVPYSMANWIEFYNQWYNLNLCLYKIWLTPLPLQIDLSRSND